MYVRLNTPRLQAGLSALTVAPNTLGQAAPIDSNSLVQGTTADSSSGVTDPNTLTIALAGLVDFPADVTGAILYVYVSVPQTASINFFKGPFQFAGIVTGDSTTPPTEFQHVYPYSLNAGDKLFVRVRYQDAQGRLSPSSIFSVIITTSV